MRQVLVLAVLLAIVAGTAELASHVAPTVAFDANTLTTTGFILLAAYAFGELLRRVRLPALLGYLAAGMLFGPSLSNVVLGDPALAPIGSEALHQLGLVNMLAVGVIGTMGGGEIKIEDLKGGFRKIAAITGVVFITVLPIVAGLVLAVSIFAPSLVPFLAEVPLAGKIAAALLFGTLAVGMSPSATLALLLEVRAHGRFTSLMLGIVVLADLVLVATFLVTLALAKLMLSPEGVSVERLLEVLPHIGAEFGWAIVLGLCVGLAFIAYLRLVGRELLLFSLGIIFVTSFVASRLHAETLLAFLVGGFVVQNFSKHGHTLIEAFEHIAMPVFVIYFTTQAATLDLVAFTTYLPLTLLLVATRLALFYFGIGGAARLAKVDDQQRRLLRISFFSQGGVDLVLAAMIAEAIPSWGPEVQTVTIATILVYILIGPPLLARALDEAGESAAARERGAETLQARRVTIETPSREAVFASLQTENPDLDHRLEILRRLVVSSARDLSHEVTVASRHRRDAIAAICARMSAMLDPATHRISQDGEDVLDRERLRADLQGLHAMVAATSTDWTESAVTPLRPTRVRAVLESLRLAVPFNASYRVAREASLFEPRGSAWQRLVRFMRRARRAVLGPGHRNVPLGRLWRFHVALDVPIALWSNPHGDEREVWARLLSHYRATSGAVEQILAGRRPSDGEPHRAMSSSHPALSGVHAAKSGVHRTGAHAAVPHDEAHGGAEEPAADPLELLAEAHAAVLEREALLTGQLQNYDRVVCRHLEAAFELAWRQFVGSVELAGTLEYPAWRYRVSARYDTAQAAMAELLERLGNDGEAAGALRDTLATLTHVGQFQTDTELAMHASGDRLTASVRACVPRIEAALEACNELGSAHDDPEREREAATELASAMTDLATAVDRVARRLERADTSGPRGSDLAEVLARVPANLRPVPLTRVDDTAERVAARRTSLPLRAWLDHTVTRALTVGLLDARAELVQAVARVGALLHHAGQVLEYHLVTGDTAGADVDRSVGDRVSSIVSRAHADLLDALASAERELQARLSAAMKAGIPPVLQGRWDEVQRLIRRVDERVGSRAALIDWLRERARMARHSVRGSLHALREEVAAVLTDATTPQEVAAYRQLLFGPASTMPEPYQRLFTSVPAENVGLVLERPEAEPVIAGVERWLSGAGGPILVRGDRGVGKRTLIRFVAGRLEDRMRMRWLPLSPDLEAEADVCRTLAQMLGVPACEDFTTLQRSARERTRFDDAREPTAIVVTNVERLFRRTPTGIDRIRRFFDLVAATSDLVLWVVLFGEPAAHLLGPVLELEGRFPVIVHVPPMDARQLEAALTMRHRLSGYELRFVQHSPSLHEWVRNPVAAWRTRRAIGPATYERLHVLSGGNARQAQRLWLAAARVDPEHEGGVVIGPLDAMSDALLDGLPLISRVLLAALLLHGPLRLRELSAVTLREGRALDAEVTHLVHLGLISMVTRPIASWESQSDPLIQVNTRLVAPLTQELRACNLL